MPREWWWRRRRRDAAGDGSHVEVLVIHIRSQGVFIGEAGRIDVDADAVVDAAGVEIDPDDHLMGHAGAHGDGSDATGPNHQIAWIGVQKNRRQIPFGGRGHGGGGILAEAELFDRAGEKGEVEIGRAHV